MTVHQLLPTTNDARHPGTGLIDALQQWRDTAWTATCESHVPEHRAIDANRVDLYMQPIVTLPQRKVRYYEAMTRLRTDTGEVLPAANFIAAAMA